MKWIGAVVILVAVGLGAFLFLRSRGNPAASSPSARIGAISHRAIGESSGLAASRKHPGVFWTHNDQGNAPVIFAINREGKCLAEFRVDDKADDWEAISVDDAGNLYVADIGNNDGNRKTVHVYRIKEPDPAAGGAEGGAKGGAKLPIERTWRLAFPDKPFDAESLFIHGGYGYVVSKLKGRQPAGLYRFPLEQEGGEKDRVPLQRVAELPIDSPVTDAAISPDANRLAVVSQKGLYLFTIGGDPTKVAEAPFKMWPLHKAHDIEGCTFTEGGVLATSETREIYFFPESGLPAGQGE